MAADIDQDQTKPRREIRQERHPVARAVGVAVDQHHRRTCRITHRDVGERLAVRQKRRLFSWPRNGRDRSSREPRRGVRCIHRSGESGSHADSCRALQRQAWRRFVSRSKNTRRTPKLFNIMVSIIYRPGGCRNRCAADVTAGCATPAAAAGRAGLATGGLAPRLRRPAGAISLACAQRRRAVSPAPASPGRGRPAARPDNRAPCRRRRAPRRTPRR